MEIDTHNKIHWSTCPECQGKGKIERGPSKKQRYVYQQERAEFENNKRTTAPEAPSKNIDKCLNCEGSGLQISEEITPVNNAYPTVAIIGGGIGGTALAVACLHRGIPFMFFERDASFDARSQGYGLTLQQASRAIKALGIPSLTDGVTSTRHVVHNPQGKIIAEWGMRRWKVIDNKNSTKRKNIHIPRQSLRLALLENLPNDSIYWGHKLIDYSLNEEGSIDINFQVGKNTKSVQADLIVGADGIRSSVRKFLINEDRNPLQYLDCFVMLGICPLKSLDDIHNHLFDSKTVFQTVNGTERIYAMPYDNDTIMWQLSFPMTESEAYELNQKGPDAMKQEALRRLSAWHEPIPEMLRATQVSDITGYPVYDREILDTTLLENAGNVTLIGDAAHPMSPFKGQGANQALLDALTLARSIADTCGPNSKWRELGLRKTLLTNFEKEMIIRTSSKVRDSAKAVKLLHSDAVLHEGDEPRMRGLG